MQAELHCRLEPAQLRLTPQCRCAHAKVALGDPCDFRLQANSPAIDQVHEPSLMTIGGLRDLGAYERGVPAWVSARVP